MSGSQCITRWPLRNDDWLWCRAHSPSHTSLYEVIMDCDVVLIVHHAPTFSKRWWIVMSCSQSITRRLLRCDDGLRCHAHSASHADLYEMMTDCDVVLIVHHAPTFSKRWRIVMSCWKSITRQPYEVMMDCSAREWRPHLAGRHVTSSGACDGLWKSVFYSWMISSTACNVYFELQGKSGGKHST